MEEKKVLDKNEHNIEKQEGINVCVWETIEERDQR